MSVEGDPFSTPVLDESLASSVEPDPPRSGDPSAPRYHAARHGYRVGVVVAASAVLVSLVLVPFALTSFFYAFNHPAQGRSFDLVQPANLHGEWTKLNFATVSLSGATQQITIRVTGFHNCPTICHAVERVQFYSVRADPSGALGPPPSVSVDLPANSGEVDQRITLPVSGKLIDYPFDHYHMLLGITFARVTASGSVITFTRTDPHAGLALSVDNTIPRTTLTTPDLASPAKYNSPGVSYDSVTSLNFSRPTYLQILTVLLTSLIVLAAAYGVMFRPFTQIVPTVGGIVLGVWGVRSLLVGSYPPDSTGVDLVLETGILFLLLAIAVRALFFMWPRTMWVRRRSPRDTDVPGDVAPDGE